VVAESEERGWRCGVMREEGEIYDGKG